MESKQHIREVEVATKDADRLSVQGPDDREGLGVTGVGTVQGTSQFVALTNWRKRKMEPQHRDGHADGKRKSSERSQEHSSGGHAERKRGPQDPTRQCPSRVS